MLKGRCHSKSDASEPGVCEPKRRHDTHNNTTANVVCYVLLSFIFAFSSPTVITLQAWIIGLSIAQLAYTYRYLAGEDNVRGLFITPGNVCYGKQSYN